MTTPNQMAEALRELLSEAFGYGFTSPETYNDTVMNSADECWAKDRDHFFGRLNSILSAAHDAQPSAELPEPDAQIDCDCLAADMPFGRCCKASLQEDSERLGALDRLLGAGTLTIKTVNFLSAASRVQISYAGEEPIGDSFTLRDCLDDAMRAAIAARATKGTT